jgi:hypothetical protein
MWGEAMFSSMQYPYQSLYLHCVMSFLVLNSTQFEIVDSSNQLLSCTRVAYKRDFYTEVICEYRYMQERKRAK